MRKGKRLSDPDHLNLHQIVRADPLGDRTSQLSSLALRDDG
jgi:hypothetical protein